MVKKFLYKFGTLLILSVLVLGLLGCGTDEPDTTPAGSMTTPRWGHSATVLNDGKLLVVGGQERASGRVGTAEIYDPVSNSWSSAGSMIDPRGKAHSSVLLSDGKAMIIGDTESGSVEIYDPTSNTWTATGSLNKARNWVSATLLSDGSVLIAGGEDANKSGRLALATAEVWDPATGEFSETGAMAEQHAGHPAVLVGDKVLVVGQFSAEIYDPSTGTWSSAGKPPRERAVGGAAVVMSDGKVMVTGGEYQRPGWTGATVQTLSNTETYDPSENTWTQTSNMSDPRKFHSSMVLNDGRVVVIGSKDKGEKTAIDVYDPTVVEEIKWPNIGLLSETRSEAFTASLLNDGRVIIVGGYFIDENKKNKDCN